MSTQINNKFGQIQQIKRDPIIVNGYWVDEAGNKIASAYLDDKFYFCIKVANIDDPTKVHADLKLSVTGFDENFCWNNHNYTPKIHGDLWFYEFIFKDKLKSNWRYGDEGKLYASFKINKTYELPKNESDYLRIAHEVGYLKKEDCRIRVDKEGDIHWIPDNCTLPTKNAYYAYIQKPDNWTYTGNTKDLGVANSTYLVTFHYDKVKSSTPARLNKSNSNPTADDTIIQISLKVKEKGKREKKIKENVPIHTANPTSNMRVGAAGFLLALNVVNAVLEYGPVYCKMYDENKIKNDIEVLNENVIPDIIQAINKNKDDLYLQNLDIENINLLYNIILCGYCEGVSEDSELYKLGKRIYKDISKLEKR